MRPGLSRAAAALAIVVALGAGWSAHALDPDTRPAVTTALDTLPVATRGAGFTHWAAIREHVGADDASSRDLSTRSVIEEQGGVLRKTLGWSLSDVEWEVYAQTNQGEHATVRLDGSVSFDDVRARLRASGYEHDGRLWTLPSDALVGLQLTDLESVVSLLPRQRLVLLTNSAATARSVLRVIDGHAPSLAGVHAAADTAQALAGSDAMLLESGRDGCKGAAISDDPDAEQQARVAERRAGGLQPYVFSGRGLADDGGSGFDAQRMVFAMTFDSAATATRQARVRERLATGPFIGRQGQVSDTLRHPDTRTDGRTLRLAFDHDPDTGVFMTGAGPALFASC